MSLKILSGSANRPLIESIARMLGVQLTPVVLERFPDSELHVEVQESVRGHNVYIIQPTCPPVDEHLLELLLRDGVRDGRWGHLDMGSGLKPLHNTRFV